MLLVLALASRLPQQAHSRTQQVHNKLPQLVHSRLPQHLRHLHSPQNRKK